MKSIAKLVLMLLVFSSAFSSMGQQEPLSRNYFQLSPRVGYDFPTYDNNTPYIDYKGGLDLGISLDYYWNWFGLGADFDYIQNNPESNYPTENMYDFSGTEPLESFSLTEDKITRIFYGIGPNVQYRHRSGRFKAELNTRFGLSNITGGKVDLQGTSANGTYPLNYHAGYKDVSVFAAKGQARFTYFFNQNFGINAGAYYLRHFGVTELNESGVSAMYQPFSEGGTEGAGPPEEGRKMLAGDEKYRVEACDCDIWSVGVFAGVTLKLTKKIKTEPEIIEHHVKVVAKDKFTGEVLPNTDVVVEDLSGNVVYSGKTNSYGMVLFNNVTAGDYIVKGKLLDVALENESIAKTEFKEEGTDIQKEIIYGNQNFILKGNVIECNTTVGIQGVNVLLRDKINPGQKNTVSTATGEFVFHLKQASTYVLKGNKDGYYSNEVEVVTTLYDRNKSLYIDFEMCVDPCGKAVKLDNINFDLDKSEILPESIPDLQRVVRLMRDNPNIKVEMSSHTDSQGSDAYNQKLSQRRADATVNYIVSQGISKDRLIARGAGESELKNTKCANNVPCTDDEHRINRRTEFKVLCFE